ncbi:beta strand repeat-containing protein [Hymenobacter properus]|uniref:Right-handed parallel beta-helix repeat-containing protein n=1 Tax=Hymenobacter properus TaxID=2791026 RepID=A0A931BHJ5_9BACT|nr:T9SS type A sorting domain-containing protein [Hymenobacter properus]MBF9141716.1 right-handed parallel beta-helix repeat-containing protein [Hymenobacter properus]MBR7720525.1 right-handed parallel beta-helix repeat-containing protein [Microvirga sp. SRT04]
MAETTTLPRPARWYRLGGALLALLLSGPAALAQLSGAYTINDAQPTGGTNFASFSAAAAALTTSGVSGPVTFSVSGGPYTEQLRLPVITGSSATNRITFNGNGRTLQFLSATAAEPATVSLNGADYVTVNNLNVMSGATAGWGIQLVNNADNNVVSNCTVTSGVAFNCGGIVSGAAATSITAAGATANQNVTITGNTVQGGYYGISVMGNTVAAPTPGVVISNNTVRDFYQYGIYAGYLTAPRITGNEATRPTATSVTTYYGIYLTTGVSGAAVERNRLHTAYAPGTSGVSYGIFVGTGAAATATSTNDVVNNLVYDISSAGATFGIYNNSSAYARYYHNTIDINDPTTQSVNSSYGFYQLLGPNVEFLNNIVRISKGGGMPQFAVYVSTLSAGSTISNYNDLSGQGANFITGAYNQTSFPTLAAWKTANNGAFDQASTNAEPGFENVATGNLRPTASPLDGKGTPLARVPQDFTGTTRSSTAPDLGAYEFTPPALDVAVLSIDALAPPLTAGPRPVVTTILNNGTTALTSVRLQYVLNGGTPVAQTFTLSNLAPGTSQSLTFTTPAQLVVGADTLTVTASLPNGQPDANATNNARTTVAYTALRGTYTINQQQPASATNFVNFGTAAAALNGGGVSGPVRLNVLNGPYTGPFVLGIIPGVSATDTVVVDGGAAKQSIVYNGTVAQSAAISLLDTDFVTLQNLTIDVAGAVGANVTYGTGVQVQGAAENNRIANCVILASLTTTSGGCIGISVAPGSSGTLVPLGNATNLRVTGNVISGGYNGLAMIGVSSSSRAAGFRAIGNEVRDFYQRGIDVENSTGARVSGNNVHRTNRSVVIAFYGIYGFNNLASVVESNRIHDSFSGAPTNGANASAYGIYYTANSGVLGLENDVINNVVYNFTGFGIDYGIYNSSTGYTRYYHNTVSLDQTSYIGTSGCYGFYQTGVANLIDFRNNLISVTRGGTGNKYALYFGTVGSTITSDYNDLYVSGTTNFTGYYGSSQTTLANWRTVNSASYDQNSVQAAPQFTDPTTGNLLPLNQALDGAGTGALLARVPRDIVGVLRPAVPDPGAYEMTVVPNDVAVVSINAPTTTGVLGTNPVTVTIRNDGTATLTAVTLSYTVTNGATPAANSQTFTGLNLGYRATQQLSFSTPITLAQVGTFTLTVTGSLPNGQPDGYAANNSQTITFDQIQPPNDEPCNAIALTGQLNGSTVNCTTSVSGGIINSLPTCSGAQLPKDAWFTWTPTVSNPTLYFGGNAAGLVRVFTAATCTTGFVQVACRASTGPNTSLGAVAFTGLTAGTQYYLAVSGYASSDPTGPFTIGLTPLGTRPQTNAAALAVFPNPTATGAFTLRLTDGSARTGRLQLLNALGQAVRTQELTAASEQQVSTRGLAPGLYTLLVQAGTETLTRKVVVE